MVGFGKRKARNFGVCALLLFVLLPGPPCGRGPPCRREQSCRVRGFTYRLGRDVAYCLCLLACANCLCRLPVADCLGQPAWATLPDAAKGWAGRGPGAVSRTCTGRRARWLGILPFRVCRRGWRCCGFSPLRGARILSCLSQGT